MGQTPMGDTSLRFNFEQERQRLNFALTLRILRTRDPDLDPANVVEVLTHKDDEDEDDGRVRTSRHVYLEFFVRYPRQDKFICAKSPTTHIPQQVLLAEDAALRRKKEKKDEAEEEEERKR